MIPQVHFNVSITSFDRVYQFFLPFVPGLIFVFGLLVGRPNLATAVPAFIGFGIYGRIASLIAASYICGFLLYAVTAISTGILSGLANALLFRFAAPKRSSAALARCTNWRVVAAEFLGDLMPQIPEPAPTATVAEKIIAPMKEMADRTGYDALWEEWYYILQDYLLRDSPIISSETASGMLVLGASGWAGVILAFETQIARHAVPLVASVIFVLFGSLAPFLAVYSYGTQDRLSYWDFTARLLAEVEKRELEPANEDKGEEAPVKPE